MHAVVVAGWAAVVEHPARDERRADQTEVRSARVEPAVDLDIVISRQAEPRRGGIRLRPPVRQVDVNRIALGDHPTEREATAAIGERLRIGCVQQVVEVQVDEDGDPRQSKIARIDRAVLIEIVERASGNRSERGGREVGAADDLVRADVDNSRRAGPVRNRLIPPAGQHLAKSRRPGRDAHAVNALRVRDGVRFSGAEQAVVVQIVVNQRAGNRVLERFEHAVAVAVLEQPARDQAVRVQVRLHALLRVQRHDVIDLPVLIKVRPDGVVFDAGEDRRRVQEIPVPAAAPHLEPADRIVRDGIGDVVAIQVAHVNQVIVGPQHRLLEERKGPAAVVAHRPQKARAVAHACGAERDVQIAIAIQVDQADASVFALQVVVRGKDLACAELHVPQAPVNPQRMVLVVGEQVGLAVAVQIAGLDPVVARAAQRGAAGKRAVAVALEDLHRRLIARHHQIQVVPRAVHFRRGKLDDARESRRRRQHDLAGQTDFPVAQPQENEQASLERGVLKVRLHDDVAVAVVVEIRHDGADRRAKVQAQRVGQRERAIGAAQQHLERSVGKGRARGLRRDPDHQVRIAVIVEDSDDRHPARRVSALRVRRRGAEAQPRRQQATSFQPFARPRRSAQRPPIPHHRPRSP